MTTFVHPARSMPFNILYEGLREQIELGNIIEKHHTKLGLTLYCYTQNCVFNKAWNPFTLIARGLILDLVNETVVATPFPKFFNPNENASFFIDYSLPFETFEKLDGSLIIIFYYQGEWHCVTKGSFFSDQAKWAKAKLDWQAMDRLDKHSTYLCEAVYPENRIVVLYSEPALVLLAAYYGNGVEYDNSTLDNVANLLGWRVAQRHIYTNFTELVEYTKNLPKDQEGFVIRFADGLRLKLKGDEYRRIHSLISNCTPLAIWQMINAGDDIMAIKTIMPEEYWSDFDAIATIILTQKSKIMQNIKDTVDLAANMTDKQLGLDKFLVEPSLKGFVFSYRKSNSFTPQLLTGIMRSIRPTGNILPGYTPSSGLRNAQADI